MEWGAVVVGLIDMEMFHDKWVKSDFQISAREPNMGRGEVVSAEVRVLDAFKAGLCFSDERIDILYRVAAEAGIIADAFHSVRRDHRYVSISVTATATCAVGSVFTRHYFY